MCGCPSFAFGGLLATWNVFSHFSLSCEKTNVLTLWTDLRLNSQLLHTYISCPPVSFFMKSCNNEAWISIFCFPNIFYSFWFRIRLFLIRKMEMNLSNLILHSDFLGYHVLNSDAHIHWASYQPELIAIKPTAL